MKTPFSFLSRRPYWLVVALSLSLFIRSADAAPMVASPSPSSVAGPAASKTPSLAAPADDIFDIRPPIHLAEEVFWAGWIAGVLAAAALGYGGWWFFRGRRRRKLPYEIALERLQAARQFLLPEQAQAFSDLVSEIVRSFVEQTFPVGAAHRTTEEFLSDLVAHADGPLAAYRDTLGEFLGHCDLAKFAKWRLSVPQMEAMLQSARDFILITGRPLKGRRSEKPAPVPQPAVTQA